KWAEAYKAKTGTSMNYQSIGSGGGMAQMTAKTVDFGASDMPLKPNELDEKGVVQLPAGIGGVGVLGELPGSEPGQITPVGAAPPRTPPPTAATAKPETPTLARTNSSRPNSSNTAAPRWSRAPSCFRRPRQMLTARPHPAST